MASKVSVTLCKIVNQPRFGEPIPSWRPIGNSETLTTTLAVPVSTTMTATAESTDDVVEQYFWRIANTGTEAIHVVTGAEDTASSTDPIWPAGCVDFLPIGAFGNDVSVVEA